MSDEHTSDGGALRRLIVAVCIGAVGALAIGGASVVVRDKLKHIPSQPARQAIPKRAVAPPPIALPLVLQANPPVPSIGQTPATTKPKTTTTATKPKTSRGGTAKGKHKTAGKTRRAGTQP